MGIFKRGKTYWYKFMFRGELIRESTKQTNDKEARKQEAAHRLRLANGEVGIREKKAAPLFKDFCKEKIEPYAKGRGKTVWYGAGMRALLRYQQLANKPLDEILGDTASEFAAWRREQKVESCSINSNLRVLRRILRLAAEWRIITAAPKIELLEGEGRREHVVTPEEEMRYLAGIDSPLLEEVALTLFDTGMRPKELHCLGWDHVRWDSGGQYGSVLVIKGKSKAARRFIPMTKRLRAKLEAKWKSLGNPVAGWVWPAETKSGHINHCSCRRAHRAALKVSKVRPFVLYSLRHTFLTRLGASGIDVWTFMRIAGHSNIQQSLAYVHPDAETVVRAVEKFGKEKGRHKIRHNQKTAMRGEFPKGAEPIAESEVYMVSAAGLEPATHALKGHCSTN